MFRMRRQDWLAVQTADKRTRANRKQRPKRRSGLRPFRKSVSSYADWLKSMGVTV